VVFDPFALLARFTSEALLHRLIRIGMIIVLVVFLISRLRDYHHVTLKPLWLVESLLFAILILAFLLRSPPRDRSRGVGEILIPLAASLLPFALLLSPPVSRVLAERRLLLGIFWCMTAATTLTIWGMWTLRHAFSITVEARALVTGGPYRFVRHPIYLGEILAAAGVTVLRFSPVNCILLALFVCLQLLRAHWEEAKLTRNFPEYSTFATRSRWFGRKSPSAKVRLESDAKR